MILYKSWKKQTYLAAIKMQFDVTDVRKVSYCVGIVSDVVSKVSNCVKIVSDGVKEGKEGIRLCQEGVRW